MDGLLIALIVVAAIVALFWFARKYTERMMQIGSLSVECYVVHKDEPARLAAMAVKAMLSKHHGKRWMKRLEFYPYDLESVDVLTRRARIFANLQYQSTDAASCLQYKEELARISPEWKRAIDKCDLNAAAMILLRHMKRARVA